MILHQKIVQGRRKAGYRKNKETDEKSNFGVIESGIKNGIRYGMDKRTSYVILFKS